MANRSIVKVTSSTAGTATLALSSVPVSGFINYPDSGLQTDGIVTTYTIRDGSDTELGTGWAYLDTGVWYQERGHVIASTNSGARISCSGSEDVFISDSHFNGASIVYEKAGGQTITNGSTAVVDLSDTNFFYTLSDAYGWITSNTSGTLVMALDGIWRLKGFIKLTTGGVFTNNSTVTFQVLYNGNELWEHKPILQAVNTLWTMVEAPPTVVYNGDSVALQIINNSGQTVTVAEARFVIEWAGEYD